ncbi:hypothetical protein ACXEGV_004658 [Klebsiella quasipneumoniae]
MKTQKTAMAVLMLVAGLASGAALAGQAVTWTNPAGESKNVVWTVRKPVDISFTVTPSDIQAMSMGIITNAGSYKNGSQNVLVTAENQTYTFKSSSMANPYASGNDAEDGSGGLVPEALVLQWENKDHKWAKEGNNMSVKFSGGETGIMGGSIFDISKSQAEQMITDLTKVKSKSFILKLNVKADQA